MTIIQTDFMYHLHYRSPHHTIYISVSFLSLVAAVGAAKAAAMDFSGALALLKNITDEVRHMKNGSGM